MCSKEWHLPLCHTRLEDFHRNSSSHPGLGPSALAACWHRVSLRAPGRKSTQPCPHFRSLSMVKYNWNDLQPHKIADTSGQQWSVTSSLLIFPRKIQKHYACNRTANISQIGKPLLLREFHNLCTDASVYGYLETQANIRNCKYHSAWAGMLITCYAGLRYFAFR